MPNFLTDSPFLYLRISQLLQLLSQVTESMLPWDITIFIVCFIPFSISAVLQRAEHRPLNVPRVDLSTSAPAPTTKAPDSICTNGPFTRACWKDGFSISTNYDSTWPVTGRTISYHLEIMNATIAPDGLRRMGALINGQYPGPTIIANWGDTLQVTVKNSLKNNGTGMHWHGLRQWHTNHMDGTNGVTECPLAPGATRTYTFLCTQFGTTWYHSHYSDQYSDGAVGAIIINGPATSNYDTDLGTMTLSDWFYRTAFEVQATLAGPGPPGDNVLINGTNVHANGSGSYHRNTITKGKKYRLRLINTSTDNGYKVSLDSHNFTVITADFVPIEPYSTNWLFLNIGQRYDVIITANQAVGSYLFHAVVQGPCGANKNGNALAIFSYVGANSTMPTRGRNSLPPNVSCNDETRIVPYVKLNVPSDQIIPQSSRLDLSLAVVKNSNGQTLVQWNLNATAMDVNWGNPTLQYVLNGDTSYPRNMNVIELPIANTWSFWIIQQVASAPPIPHPIHLHGHDFYVLGSGIGVYNDPTTLNYNNPPRRDVATLPGGGYLVIAFITDNPGAWLMHCHIAWHIGSGLGSQFLEQKSNIAKTLNIGSDWKSECSQWNAYYAKSVYKQTDSGL